MIVIYFIIIAGIVIYYLTQSTPAPKQASYRNATAGDVEHIPPLVSRINDLSNKSFKYEGKNVDIKDYEVFIVNGDSMQKCGIRTGNGVLVSRIFDRNQLHRGEIIVYEINPERYRADHPGNENAPCGFKIRQYLCHACLTESNEDIYNEAAEADPALKENANRSKLLAKLEKAREYYEANANVIISITYRNGTEKDYSIHAASELYGVVKYIIPDELIKKG